MLSQQAVKEFQDIYQNEYGAALLPDQAALLGQNLLHLYKAMLKPLPPIKKGSRS